MLNGLGCLALCGAFFHTARQTIVHRIVKKAQCLQKYDNKTNFSILYVWGPSWPTRGCVGGEAFIYATEAVAPYNTDSWVTPVAILLRRHFVRHSLLNYFPVLEITKLHTRIGTGDRLAHTVQCLHYEVKFPVTRNTFSFFQNVQTGGHFVTAPFCKT